MGNTAYDWTRTNRAGCTTIPEDWHIPCSSNIHSVFIGAGSWFYEGYAGIQADPERPGFAHFLVWPQIPKAGLDWVETSYESVRGPIRSAWRKEGGGVIVDVTVPANTAATVRLPDGQEKHVAPGKHVLVS